MDTNYTYVFLATLFSVAFALKLLLSRSKRKQNLPPGPQRLPVVGHLHLMGKLPHIDLQKLSKQHGDVMQLWFGSAPVVVVNSEEMARQVLSVHDHVLSHRPPNAVGKYVSFDYSDMLWSSYGPYWRYLRKIAASELLSAKRIEFFEPIRTEEVHGLLGELNATAGQKVNMKEKLMMVNFNIISQIVFGKKYFDNPQQTLQAINMSSKEFNHNIMEEFFFLNGNFFLGDLIPWLGFLDLQGFKKRMKVLNKNINKFLEFVIKEHEDRSKGVDNYVAKDMTDVLLKLADDPEQDVKLTRNGIKGFMMNLLAGGIDTASITVEWALSELLRRPSIFEKATEELDKVIGRDRWITEKDIGDLPYLEAIVKETMRMHPVSTILPARYGHVDVNVGGYDVPSGTRIIVNVWALGRDPRIWESPEEFRPERFLGKDIDVKGRHFCLLPFGGGRRMCPGYNVGLKLIQTTLGNLLHGFNWRLPEELGPDDVSMEEWFMLTTPKLHPIEVVVEPRLAPHVYKLL